MTGGKNRKQNGGDKDNNHVGGNMRPGTPTHYVRHSRIVQRNAENRKKNKREKG